MMLKMSPSDSVINVSNLFFLSFFSESVRALLGRHTKILVKYMIKLETKGDKTENRVLVSTVKKKPFTLHAIPIPFYMNPFVSNHPTTEM